MQSRVYKLTIAKLIIWQAVFLNYAPTYKQQIVYLSLNLTGKLNKTRTGCP